VDGSGGAEPSGSNTRGLVGSLVTGL